MSSTGLPSPTPDCTLAANDPGDETASRFRFQYAWAAITCCMLFDDAQDVVEVFCEHHEDVLLKHRDGKFTGHQVKTRGSEQPLWKAGDEHVRAACAKFVRLDADFPGHFRAYRFLTSHPLYATQTAQSLGYALAEILAAPTLDDLPKGVLAWVRRVTQQAGASETVTFQALKKATAAADLPKLQDVMMRLVNALVGCWAGAEDCSHDSVVRAAYALVENCARASALDHEQLLPAYVLASCQPDSNVATRIAGKRMTLDRVRAILAEGLNTTAPLAGIPMNYRSLAREARTSCSKS